MYLPQILLMVLFSQIISCLDESLPVTFKILTIQLFTYTHAGVYNCGKQLSWFITLYKHNNAVC